MRRAAVFLLAALILMGCGAVCASGGTSGETLVSQSYLNDTYLPAVAEQAGRAPGGEDAEHLRYGAERSERQTQRVSGPGGRRDLAPSCVCRPSAEEGRYRHGIYGLRPASAGGKRRSRRPLRRSGGCDRRAGSGRRGGADGGTPLSGGGECRRRRDHYVGYRRGGPGRSLYAQRQRRAGLQRAGRRAEGHGPVPGNRYRLWLRIRPGGRADPGGGTGDVPAPDRGGGRRAGLAPRAIRLRIRPPGATGMWLTPTPRGIPKAWAPTPPERFILRPIPSSRRENI